MDIGTNVGQWAFTIKKLFPNIKVYSFEPNKKIFDLLNFNKKELNAKDWFTFQYAISNKEEARKFYFSESASAEGSFYKENMSQNYVRPDVQETKVKAISLNKASLRKLKLPNYFDLVKIDVEGAEKEVLQGLSGIKFRYLEIEVIRKRAVGITLSQVEKHFKALGFKVKLLYEDFFDETSPVGNAVFEITK